MLNWERVLLLVKTATTKRVKALFWIPNHCCAQQSFCMISDLNVRRDGLDDRISGCPLGSMLQQCSHDGATTCFDDSWRRATRYFHFFSDDQGLLRTLIMSDIGPVNVSRLAFWPSAEVCLPASIEAQLF
jgi:hypothetical protein